MERIDLDRDTTQIVHVHGTYWFYDCCNLRGEITHRAASAPTRGMQSLLDRILANRSPIVLGYSGWESDVFMTSLRRRLAGRLPYNIYWFSYNGDANALPLWLVEHQDVVLVVPIGPKNSEDGSPSGTEEEVLDAASCLEALIRRFDLSAPPAVQDPLAALLDRLRSQIPNLGVAAGFEDIYQLEAVVANLEELRSNISHPATTLEEARDAYRRSDYAQALALCLALPVTADDQEQHVASMIASSLIRGKTPVDRLITQYPEALDRVRAATKRFPALRIQLGSLLNAYGRSLTGQDPARAIEVLDEAINLEGGESAARRRQLARSYSSKAQAYAAQDKWEEALAVIEKLIGLVRSDPELQSEASVAEVNRATALARSGRVDEALSIYERMRGVIAHGSSSAAYWRFMQRYMEALEEAGRDGELREVAATLVSAASEAGNPDSAHTALSMASRVLDEA